MAGLLTCGSQLTRTFPNCVSSGPIGVAHRSQLRGQSRIWCLTGQAAPCSLFISSAFGLREPSQKPNRILVRRSIPKRLITAVFAAEKCAYNKLGRQLAGSELFFVTRSSVAQRSVLAICWKALKPSKCGVPSCSLRVCPAPACALRNCSDFVHAEKLDSLAQTV